MTTVPYRPDYFSGSKGNPSYDRLIWEYNKTDFSDLRESLQRADWDSCLHTDNIDTACKLWTETFLNVARETIPNKTATIRPSDSPWFTSRLRTMRRKKLRLHNKAKNSNNNIQVWAYYRRFRNHYQDELKLAEEMYNKKLKDKLREGKTKDKAWWRTVKQFLGRAKDHTTSSLLWEDKVLSDDKSKAEALNSYFLKQSTVGSVEEARAPECEPNTPEHFLNEIHITEGEVLDILKTLNVSKASGPDGISPRMLKEAAPCIADPLAKLFNLSLTLNKFPNDWKKANVLPLHKKGPENACENYRPISLLNVVGKVFEKIIFKHIYNFFLQNQVITPFQSGFVRGDSTVNQLLYLYQQFAKALDEQKEVRIVFFDITKAFDKVWHEGLMVKLKKAGISGSLLEWLKDYLMNRNQRVVLNGQCSSWGPLKAGVPQGSVLGPLLFLIYINDIANIVNSHIRLFADDVTLFLEVDDPGTTAGELNEDLQKISDWAEKWLVTFNPSKTKHMLISRKRIQRDHPSLYFKDKVITDVNEHKHLGLIVQNDLTWFSHIESLVEKSSKLVNIMRSLQSCLDRPTLETIYISFIRPLMEYGHVVWANCTQAEQTMLEGVQLAAARVVTGAMRGTPNNRLYMETGWEPLDKRREKRKLILMYKIKNNEVPLYLQNAIPDQMNTRNYNTRSSHNMIHARVRTSLYSESFFPSTIRLWNELPSNIRHAEHITIFKKYLDKRYKIPPKNPLFHLGNRYTSILHARLRMGCSQLNDHLFKLGIKDSKSCSCGALNEDTYHFFFNCPKYNSIRIDLHENVIRVASFTLKTVLYGSDECSYFENSKIFLAVHSFIEKSKRFNPP